MFYLINLYIAFSEISSIKKIIEEYGVNVVFVYLLKIFIEKKIDLG